MAVPASPAGRRPRLADRLAAAAGGASSGGEFARLAGEAGVPAVRLDGRDIDPSPPGFLAGLGRAMDEPPDASPLETSGTAARTWQN